MSIINIIIVGLILALLVGLAAFHLLKERRLDANRGFAWGFGSTLIVAAISAILVFFKNKRKKH